MFTLNNHSLHGAKPSFSVDRRKLQKALERKGITMKELSRRAEIEYHHLFRIFGGGVAVITYLDVQAIKKELDL